MPVPSTSPGPAQTAPRAGLALGLLLSINLFNYIDRQVLSAVLPQAGTGRRPVRPGRPEPEVQARAADQRVPRLVHAFSPVFGWLGDRVVAVGPGRRSAVIVWSLASGGSGLATGFVMLLLTRCLVGIGEAAYGPVAPAMLSDLYPVRDRGQVMAWFYMAIPVGSALGFVIGGLVAGHGLGLAGGVPGRRHPRAASSGPLLLHAGPAAHRGRRSGRRDPASPGYRRAAGTARHPVVRPVLRGMTCTTFMLGGVAAWAPTYIFEREARFA